MFWVCEPELYTEYVASYTYKELEKDIFDAVKKLDDSGFFGRKDRKLTILEGFVSMPLQPTTGNYNIGGKSLPTVAVVDLDNGQTWFLSLKQLVPKVELG